VSQPGLRRFTCENCGRPFWSDQTDEVALAAMVAEFGDVPTDERAVVCTDCYTVIMSMITPPRRN